MRRIITSPTTAIEPGAGPADGQSINLSLVYLLLARRLGLPIAALAFRDISFAAINCSSAEVFIDAFNCGKLLTKRIACSISSRGITTFAMII